MPEGDTLWRTAAAIRNRVGGQQCTGAKPDEFRRLVGRTLVEVEAYGKHLFMRFDSGIAVHSHMRMTGVWHLYRTGQRWKRPDWQAKAALEFGDHVAVVFSAPVVELVRGRRIIEHLGPDILAEPFDLALVLQNARRSDAPTIGELLLDQRVCAGIGNIYKCESLWELRLNPWARPDEVTDTNLKRLYEVARRKMREATDSHQVRQPRAVHARGGKSCPRCFSVMRVRPQGEQGRLTYWCPRCQSMDA